MSRENLEQFLEQVADNEELQARIGDEIHSDALITLGTECGYEFTVEDLQESAELSDEELEMVAGGTDGRAVENMMGAWDGRTGFSFAKSGAGRWSLTPTWMPGC
jgi:predicted ribosomally synthesized peptide with nif11-like leader|tara:strand:- start:208 stop:522 length:315 start_codon:yes stop_codon:yes gene_type:complete